jgi:hypothetical protein
MHANPGVIKLLQERLTSVAKAVEDSVDDELHRLDNLTEDDLEEVRRKRLEQMKRGAAKRQEWLARGHGTYREIPGERVRGAGARHAIFVFPARHLNGRPATRASRDAGVLFGDEGRGAHGVPLLQRQQHGVQGAALRQRQSVRARRGTSRSAAPARRLRTQRRGACAHGQRNAAREARSRNAAHAGCADSPGRRHASVCAAMAHVGQRTRFAT